MDSSVYAWLSRIISKATVVVIRKYLKYIFQVDIVQIVYSGFFYQQFSKINCTVVSIDNARNYMYMILVKCAPHAVLGINLPSCSLYSVSFNNFLGPQISEFGLYDYIFMHVMHSQQHIYSVGARDYHAIVVTFTFDNLCGISSI